MRNRNVSTLVTWMCLPYSHEHLPKWDRVCAPCVELLCHTYHRLAVSLPNKRLWAFFHALYKPQGHSCCLLWKIRRPSPEKCSPLSDPWRSGANTEDNSGNSHYLVCPNCPLGRIYRICVCKWGPLADWEYFHKLGRKGHLQNECVW